MKPMGFFLANKRASLTRVRMAPTTGADAEVPNRSEKLPSSCLVYKHLRKVLRLKDNENGLRKPHNWLH